VIRFHLADGTTVFACDLRPEELPRAGERVSFTARGERHRHREPDPTVV
jgi:hypothetical protein